MNRDDVRSVRRIPTRRDAAGHHSPSALSPAGAKSGEFPRGVPMQNRDGVEFSFNSSRFFTNPSNPPIRLIIYSLPLCPFHHSLFFLIFQSVQSSKPPIRLIIYSLMTLAFTYFFLPVIFKPSVLIFIQPFN
jgi:hypothetical protein